MLKALKDMVIIEMIEQENTTASGLIIKGVTDKQTEGRVVSIGSQVQDMYVGDRVLVDWNRVVKIKHKDHTYFATKEVNVIAVFE